MKEGGLCDGAEDVLLGRLPEHFPDPAAAETEDDAVPDLHPWETSGDPLGEEDEGR